MTRPHNPTIRKRLRDQAVDYVLSHGTTDFALRPLAKTLNTNARMLIYHFGSREGLMREILSGLREHGDVLIRGWLRGGKKVRTVPEFLHWYWRRMSAPQARSAVRLTFELYSLALKHPKQYPGVLTDPLAYWQSLVAREAELSDGHRAEATLLLAVTRGLLLDLCATGDRARVEHAMKLFTKMLQSNNLHRDM